MNTNEIQIRLQDCETLQELNLYWDSIKRSITDENKIHLIEVKEVMKEYLSNRNDSNIEEVKLNEWWKEVLNMSVSEKKRLTELYIKKLKYYGALRLIFKQ